MTLSTEERFVVVVVVVLLGFVVVSFQYQAKHKNASPIRPVLCRVGRKTSITSQLVP